MKNIRFILPFIISVVIIVIGAVFYFNQSNNSNTSSSSSEKSTTQIEKVKPKAIVYKSSTCGCCRVYVGYLKKQGFNVEIRDMQDLKPIKNQYKIATDKLSCHTTVIGNYFFEGHIPVVAINKVLKEKPAIQGIALPGMPSGSPGMPGPKYEKFAIDKLDNNSKWSNYINL